MRITEAKTLFPRADVAASRIIPNILHEASMFGTTFFPAAATLAIAGLSMGGAARKRLHLAFGEGSTFDGEDDALFEYTSVRMSHIDGQTATQQEIATGRFFASLRQCARENPRRHITVFDLLVSSMGSMDPVLADFFEESGRGISQALIAIDAPGWAVYPSFDYGVPTP